MSEDRGSLSGLHDIVTPDPVGFWPPDTGGILLLLLILLCLLLVGFQCYAKYRKNRYRRVGLELLGQAKTTGEVSVTLKRVALAAFPREQVASLYGSDWVDFLNTSYGRKGFNAQFFSEPEGQPNIILINSAKQWIASHEAADRTDEE